MQDIVSKLLDVKRGILAADESTHTIEKRFAALNIKSTPETHRIYRQMLFTTPGLEQYLSGIILFDETVRQTLDNGLRTTDYLTQNGIIPGIKVDEGLEPFEDTDQQVTKGLDGLSLRLIDYSKFGLKFTKWRAAIPISDIFPTEDFLEEDLNRMTSFAKISQENGFVPIVEPEVLLDGNHTTTRCEEIETKVLKLLFEKLKTNGVDLTNIILKTSMTLPGKDNGIKAEPLEVAQATLRTLRNSVPRDVPGIVFLSGGQSPDEATSNLNQINILAKDGPASANYPWQLSFSYSRALQNEALDAWSGNDNNILNAQKIFLMRLEKVSLARQGLLE